MSPLICSFQLNDTAISLTRQASVHNVDFWQEKKKSTIAVLSCQSPGSLHEACLSCVWVVCLSPYRRLAQCSQDRTHPSLSTPVASVHGFPLRTRDSQPFWHAAMLASMQKKKTKSIRLIGASIFLFFLGGGCHPSPGVSDENIPLDFAWYGLVQDDGSAGWRARTDGSCPEHPLCYRTSYFSRSLAHKMNRKQVHSKATAKGQDLAAQQNDHHSRQSQRTPYEALVPQRFSIVLWKTHAVSRCDCGGFMKSPV